MRILVVEEVGFVRHNLEHLLKQNDYDVTTTDSCDHGLEILRKDPLIDVVIAPVIMTGLNGVDLYREARKIERMDDAGGYATFDFLLTTTEISSGDSKTLEMMKHAQDLGISEILLKPIDSQKLLSILNIIEHPELAEPKEVPSTSISTEATQSGVSNGQSNMTASEIQILREVRQSLAASSNEIATRIQQIDDVCKTIEN